MGPSETIRHVVWDWNGTLLDDFEIIIEATTVSCGELREDPISAVEYREKFARPLDQFYARLLGRPVTTDEWQRIDQRFHDHYASRFHEVLLAVDAIDALGHAERAGLTQSLLSMWSHAELVAAVSRYGLEDYFCQVDGRRAAADGGGKHRHMVSHLDRLGIDPAHVLVIGDSLDDGEAATAVGAHAVLVEGGSHDAAAFARAGLRHAPSLVAALQLAGVG